MASDFPPVRERELREKRLHFGLVFQDFNLFPQYTALENVTLARRLAKLPGESEADIRDRGLALLEQMGLSDRAGHYPHQLSGGMLQRIMIGIATAMEPVLLIADEPTTAIDAITQYEILNEFLRVKQEKQTAMVFISHDLNAISRVADRIVVLNQGRVVDEGDFQHILHHAQDPYTRLLVEKRADVMRRYRQVLTGKEQSYA